MQPICGSLDTPWRPPASKEHSHTFHLCIFFMLVMEHSYNIINIWYTFSLGWKKKVLRSTLSKRPELDEHSKKYVNL